jgi:hypothetical protein
MNKTSLCLLFLLLLGLVVGYTSVDEAKEVTEATGGFLDGEFENDPED